MNYETTKTGHTSLRGTKQSSYKQNIASLSGLLHSVRNDENKANEERSNPV
jgi:hypothetical protein